MDNARFSVHIAGEFACFTRPEMKVERVSYEVITPSAARNILRSILWKPQMRWVIERIVVLREPRFVAFRRNEVSKKVPSTARAWAARNHAPPYHADDDRQQRNTLALRDQAWVVAAHIELSERAESEDSVEKYAAMFTRRMQKGQHFQQPYLGCREFPATVRMADGDDVPEKEVLRRGTVDLGRMLLDIDYDATPRLPVFFHAEMREGVIEIPSMVRGGRA